MVLLLAALADPVRREIVELLADGDLTAGGIAARFPVSRPAVSRHLRVLREAELVRSEVHGKQHVYTLERAALVGLDRWLDRFRPLPSVTPAVAPAVPLSGTPAPARVTGPAGRLDALETELRRGRRARRTAHSDPIREDPVDDSSAR